MRFSASTDLQPTPQRMQAAGSGLVECGVSPKPCDLPYSRTLWATSAPIRQLYSCMAYCGSLQARGVEPIPRTASGLSRRRREEGEMRGATEGTTGNTHWQTSSQYTTKSLRYRSSTIYRANDSESESASRGRVPNRRRGVRNTQVQRNKKPPIANHTSTAETRNVMNNKVTRMLMF